MSVKQLCDRLCSQRAAHQVANRCNELRCQPQCDTQDVEQLVVTFSFVLALGRFMTSSQVIPSTWDSSLRSVKPSQYAISTSRKSIVDARPAAVPLRQEDHSPRSRQHAVLTFCRTQVEEYATIRLRLRQVQTFTCQFLLSRSSSASRGGSMYKGLIGCPRAIAKRNHVTQLRGLHQQSFEIRDRRRSRVKVIVAI